MTEKVEKIEEKEAYTIKSTFDENNIEAVNIVTVGDEEVEVRFNLQSAEYMNILALSVAAEERMKKAEKERQRKLVSDFKKKVEKDSDESSVNDFLKITEMHTAAVLLVGNTVFADLSSAFRRNGVEFTTPIFFDCCKFAPDEETPKV